MNKPKQKKEEVWRWVNGLEGYYEVSNKKRVRSWQYGTKAGGIKKRGHPKIMPPFVGGTGYYTVYLGVKGVHKKRFHRIHKLWADIFLPNPDNKPFLNHKDGNKLNNADDNIEWCTPKENMHHAFRTGLIVFKNGEAHHRSKLTEKEVLEIMASPLGIWVLSKKYGVNKSTIGDIRKGIIWNSVTGLPKTNPKLKILK